MKFSTLIYLAVALLAGGGGYLYFCKRETFDKLVSKARALFKKSAVPAPIVPAGFVVPVATPEGQTPGFNFEWHRYKGQRLPDAIVHLYARGFEGELTPAQLEDARAAGVIIPVDVAPVVKGDPTGFHVTYQNSPRTNTMQNGHPYTATFEGPGKVRISPKSGSEINEVNGKYVNGGMDIARHDGSPLTFWVKGVGAFGPPEVAIELQQVA